MTTRPRKQDRKYWDAMAAKWDDEIFNTLHHDKHGILPEEIRRASRGAHSVADFGCGTGIYLPLLSRLFGDVHGFERSSACVAIARKAFSTVENIRVHPATAAAVRRGGQFDVVLCVNVSVHPTARGRASVYRSLRSLLAPNGRLLLVVPSLESAFMVAEAEREALRGRGGDWEVASRDGVVTIEGMPYKHYSRPELAATISGLGLALTRVRKVEYSWRSQGVRPGAKWRGTLPWDWLVVARRER